MPQINIRKIWYAFRHKYWTFNNIVIAVAFLIVAGWVWGSLQVMQRNYNLQKEVDFKQRQLELTQLQKDSLNLQKKYYESDEYRELALRDSMGLVMPNEKLLILPPNTEAAKLADQKASAGTSATAGSQTQAGNLEQWLNFLFGGYSKSVNPDKE